MDTCSDNTIMYIMVGLLIISVVWCMIIGAYLVRRGYG